MCGINGIAFTKQSGKKVDPHLLDRMRDVISYRGPDGSGAYVSGGLGLGHRRLSIVDLETGDQPMFNADRSCVIVYNGEIYNHADHREGLEHLGYRFQSRSDTEAILNLYEAFGTDCVHRLRGMFAFAIWNVGKEELFIARDRLGVKPLYYVHDSDGSLFFASEIKSLIEAGALKPELDVTALPEMLANYGTVGSKTMFCGVKRLEPGHFLIWKDGKIKISRYWELRFDEKPTDLSDAETVEAWSEKFRESVRLRLMSDVPLGMFLSGGIDSSAIAAVMAHLADGPVKTFSVGFAEQEANEFYYARMVAQHLGTEHHEITITPEQFFAELPHLVWHEDEPLSFEASVPLYFVSRLASEHVKVVLTGEGSDETLAGYGRYRKAISLLNLGRTYESLAPGSVRGAVRSGVAALPASINRRLQRTFLSLDADIESLYFDNFSVFGRRRLERLFTADAADILRSSSPYAGLHEIFNERDADTLLDRLLFVDTRTYLHELLMKQDQMSMAASIESRVPFLDHELVEFTASLPDKMKLRGRTTKWVLRKAMQGVLPPEILSRRKMGFPVPLAKWLRGEFRFLVEEYLLSDRSRSRGIFDDAALRSLVAEHDRGEDHASRIFRLINLEMWQRIFVDGERPAPGC
jgi:asparagine synthase (glutamine-hydrolysing)